MKPEVFTDSPLWNLVITASSSFQAARVMFIDPVLSLMSLIPACLWNEDMLQIPINIMVCKWKFLINILHSNVTWICRFAARACGAREARGDANVGPQLSDSRQWQTDSAVQASLSLPATPLDKNLDNAFTCQTGRRLFRSEMFTMSRVCMTHLLLVFCSSGQQLH